MTATAVILPTQGRTTALPASPALSRLLDTILALPAPDASFGSAAPVWLGTTPVRYLWSARVRLGVHLLENTTLPIAEIARRVGCRSPKHFARLVRADVGAPPSELRHRTLVEA